MEMIKYACISCNAQQFDTPDDLKDHVALCGDTKTCVPPNLQTERCIYMLNGNNRYTRLCLACKQRPRNNRVYGDVRTMYCTKCSQTCHPEWYKAYKATGPRACTKCTMPRSVRVYQGLKTEYCIACSQIYCPDWYAAYRSSDTCAAVGCSMPRARAVYRGIKTMYCVACSQTCHREWYNRYKAGNVCASGDCNKARSMRIYRGISTHYCIACSRRHDRAWYNAYKTNNVCENATCNVAKCPRVYDGLKTDYCTNCSQTHQPEWYAAYRASDPCAACAQTPRNGRIFGGLQTRYCITCAQVHHAEWYQAYKMANACATCNTPRCPRIFNHQKTMYCVRCSKIHDRPWYDAWVAQTACRCGVMGVFFAAIHAYRCNMCAIEDGLVQAQPAGVSKAACRFLDNLGRLENVNIPHVHFSDGVWSGREVSNLVPHRRVRPDGFLGQTVYLFHGNLWHGYPPDHPLHSETNFMGRSNAEMYHATMANMQLYKDQNYNVVYGWEHENQRELKYHVFTGN